MSCHTCMKGRRRRGLSSLGGSDASWRIEGVKTLMKDTWIGDLNCATSCPSMYLWAQQHWHRHSLGSLARPLEFFFVSSPGHEVLLPSSIPIIVTYIYAPPAAPSTPHTSFRVFEQPVPRTWDTAAALPTCTDRDSPALQPACVYIITPGAISRSAGTPFCPSIIYSKKALNISCPLM